MPSGTLEIDLRQLSAKNYHRHRAWRYASVAGGIIWEGILVWVFAFYATSTVGHGLGVAVLLYVGAIVVLFMCIGLFIFGSIAKELAMGPSTLQIDDGGLKLSFLNGRRNELSWSSPFDHVELLIRPETNGIPPEARFRLRMQKSRREAQLIWRITPATYLPAGVVERIVNSAKSAGMQVEAQQGPPTAATAPLFRRPVSTLIWITPPGLR
jgi:hypothetical protein